MVTLVQNEWNFQVEKAELVELERQVLTVLNGDLLTATPIFFLERFQRIFGVDQEKQDASDALVGDLARKFIKSMQLRSIYLNFTPSQIAAAALMLSMNICSSPFCCRLVGVEQPFLDLDKKGWFFQSASEVRELLYP